MARNVEQRATLVPEDGAYIAGDLVIPEDARGVVLFAHGCDSGRHRPRNRFVAEELRKDGLATMLLDLLTPDEELFHELSGGRLRFDIDLLARRVDAASNWLAVDPDTRYLPLGYFGASTGAAAALTAAAEWNGTVGAIVSRGGRPDLAGSALASVRAPTLLIVGGRDEDVIELNRSALEMMRCQKNLEIVPGATHLFEEPGTLEQVVEITARWFLDHLGAAARQPGGAPHAGW